MLPAGTPSSPPPSPPKQPVLRLAPGVFELSLVVAPSAQGNHLRNLGRLLEDEYYRKASELSNRYAQMVLKSRGIYRKRLCPFAEVFEPERFSARRRPGECPKCTTPDDAVYCSSCELGATFLGAFDVPPSQTKQAGIKTSYLFGTYDLAALWQAPDHLSSAEIRDCFRSATEGLDVVSIPISRILDYCDEVSEHSETVNPKITALSFLQPRTWTPGDYRALIALLELARDAGCFGRGDVTAEIYLTYSLRYPLLVKLESSSETALRGRLRQLHGLMELKGKAAIGDSWTAYGTTSIPDISRCPEATCEVEFLVLARMQGKDMETRRHLAEQIERALQRHEFVRPSTIGLSETELRTKWSRLLAGQHDALIVVRGPGAIKMAAVVADVLRPLHDEGLERILTVPFLYE